MMAYGKNRLSAIFVKMKTLYGAGTKGRGTVRQGNKTEAIHGLYSPAKTFPCHSAIPSSRSRLVALKVKTFAQRVRGHSVTTSIFAPLRLCCSTRRFLSRFEPI